MNINDIYIGIAGLCIAGRAAQIQMTVIIPCKYARGEAGGQLTHLSIFIKPDIRLILVFVQLAARHFKGGNRPGRVPGQIAGHRIFRNVFNRNRSHRFSPIYSRTRKAITIVLASVTFPSLISSIRSSIFIFDTLSCSSGSKCWPRNSPFSA